ncbi:MAG: tetratricopeptide repeat protein [Mariprofundus sp.]|nr:tetratricopeptide repeat protein [Mariprofundus sp.]
MAVIFLCALTLSACASDDKKISLEQVWTQDKQQINASLTQLRDHQTKSDLALQQQETITADMQKQIDELKELNQAQQVQVSAISNRIERLHRKTAVKTVKADAPASKIISKPELTLRTTPVKALPPALPVAVPAPKVDTAAMVEAEKNAYTSAYLALKSGRYDEAANAFNKQLDLYPEGEYADQAWYWLGETRLAQNNNDRALNAFKYVADHYPNSVKHAAALFKLGQISEAQNKFQQSAIYYKRLIRDHADSSLAEQAREALGRTQATPGTQKEN